ncbi:MAG: glycosyltransferase family 2 protein [Candidatus Calescibacterium sp.]|jgi:glycosyltransferase involved in cell wall biosynthesis
MRPLFSIVIPTRDRPNLLREAIQSALEQEFDDYEIIVSDNSTNSETEKVVSEFESKKLKYFRTPKPLDMPRSWDFALSKANGKFITFLADDDLLPKKFLRFYSKIVNLKENKGIKVFFHGLGVFSCIDEGAQIQNLSNFVGRKYSLVYYILNSKEGVRKFDARYLFKWQISSAWRWITPHASFVDKNFYDFIKSRYGRCFFNWAPDITFPTIALYELSKENNNSVCGISIPLLIVRDTYYSYGFGAKGNPDKVKEFLHQFENFKGSLLFSPFKDLFTLENSIYDSFLIAFNIIGENEVCKLVGKDAIRDFYRKVFIRILKELEDLSKKDKFYKKYQIKVKRYFYFWKIKNFLSGLIQDREYVKEVLFSRLKYLLHIQDKKDSSYLNILTYYVSDLTEALNITDRIVNEKISQLNLD